MAAGAYGYPAPQMVPVPMPPQQMMPAPVPTNPVTNPFIHDKATFLQDGDTLTVAGKVIELYRRKNPIAQAVKDAATKGHPYWGFITAQHSGPLQNLKIAGLDPANFGSLVIGRYRIAAGGQISFTTETSSLMQLCSGEKIDPAQLAQDLAKDDESAWGWWTKFTGEKKQKPLSVGAKEFKPTPPAASGTPPRSSNGSAASLGDGDSGRGGSNEFPAPGTPNEETQKFLANFVRTGQATRPDNGPREDELTAARKEAEEAKLAALAAERAFKEQQEAAARKTAELEARIAALEKAPTLSPTPSQLNAAAAVDEKKEEVARALAAQNAAQNKHAAAGTSGNQKKNKEGGKGKKRPGKKARAQKKREEEAERKRKEAADKAAAEATAERERLAQLELQKAKSAEKAELAKRRQEQQAKDAAAKARTEQAERDRKAAAATKAEKEAEAERLARIAQEKAEARRKARAAHQEALRKKREAEQTVKDKKEREEAEALETAFKEAQKGKAASAGPAKSVTDAARRRELKAKLERRIQAGHDAQEDRLALTKRGKGLVTRMNPARENDETVVLEEISGKEIEGADYFKKGNYVAAVDCFRYAAQLGNFSSNLNLFRSLRRVEEASARADAYALMDIIVDNLDQLRQDLRDSAVFEGFQAHLTDSITHGRAVDPEKMFHLINQARVKLKNEDLANCLTLQLIQTGHHPDWPKTKVCQNNNQHCDPNCSHSFMCNLKSDWPQAQFYRGCCYVKGLGVTEIDREKGEALLEQACNAKQPCLEALNYYGKYLLHHKEDPHQSRYYFNKAAQEGSIEAQKHLVTISLEAPGAKLINLDGINQYFVTTAKNYTTEERKLVMILVKEMIQKTCDEVERMAKTAKTVKKHKERLLMWSSAVSFLESQGKSFLEDYENHQPLIERATKIRLNIIENMEGEVFTVFQITDGVKKDPVQTELETDSRLKAIAPWIAMGKFEGLNTDLVARAYQQLGSAVFTSKNKTIEDSDKIIRIALAAAHYVAEQREDESYAIKAEIDLKLKKVIYLSEMKGKEAEKEAAMIELIATMARGSTFARKFKDQKMLGQIATNEASLYLNGLHPEFDKLPACGHAGCVHEKVLMLLEPHLTDCSDACILLGNLHNRIISPDCRFKPTPEKLPDILAICKNNDAKILSYRATTELKGPKPNRKRALTLIAQALELGCDSEELEHSLKHLFVEESIKKGLFPEKQQAKADGIFINDKDALNNFAKVFKYWVDLDDAGFEPENRKALAQHLVAQGSPTMLLQTLNLELQIMLNPTLESTTDEKVAVIEVLDNCLKIFDIPLNDELAQSLLGTTAALRIMFIGEKKEEAISNAAFKTRLTLLHKLNEQAFNTVVKTTQLGSKVVIQPLEPVYVTGFSQMIKEPIKDPSNFSEKLSRCFAVWRLQQNDSFLFETAAHFFAEVIDQARSIKPTQEQREKINVLGSFCENQFHKRLAEAAQWQITDKIDFPMARIRALYHTATLLSVPGACQEAQAAIKESARRAQKEIMHVPFKKRSLQDFINLHDLSLLCDSMAHVERYKDDQTAITKPEEFPKITCPAPSARDYGIPLSNIAYAAQILEDIIENDTVRGSRYCTLAAAGGVHAISELCDNFKTQTYMPDNDLALYCNTISSFIASGLCVPLEEVQTADQVITQIKNLTETIKMIVGKEPDHYPKLVEAFKHCLQDVAPLLQTRACNEKLGLMPASKGKLSWEEAFVQIKALLDNPKKTALSETQAKHLKFFLEIFEKGTESAMDTDHSKIVAPHTLRLSRDNRLISVKNR